MTVITLHDNHKLSKKKSNEDKTATLLTKTDIISIAVTLITISQITVPLISKSNINNNRKQMLNSSNINIVQLLQLSAHQVICDVTQCYSGCIDGTENVRVWNVGSKDANGDILEQDSVKWNVMQ